MGQKSTLSFLLFSTEVFTEHFLWAAQRELELSTSSLFLCPLRQPEDPLLIPAPAPASLNVISFNRVNLDRVSGADHGFVSEPKVHTHTFPSHGNCAVAQLVSPEREGNSAAFCEFPISLMKVAFYP